MQRLGWLFVLFLSGIQSVYAFDHDHPVFNQLLGQIVVEQGHQTSVDYAALKSDPAGLAKYIEQVESVRQPEFNAWNKNQQLAFLINVYNALTLKLILDNYPEIDSIRDLGGLIFSSPWDIEFFKLFGKDATLDYVEHDLIRGNFDEPRIHFAVNCASRGCPPLMKQAYHPDSLDQQLEHATRLFLTDPDRNRYNPVKKRLELSSIFKWYRQDFVDAAGSLEAFVAPYIINDPALVESLQSRNYNSLTRVSVRFLEYDWSLNEIK